MRVLWILLFSLFLVGLAHYSSFVDRSSAQAVLPSDAIAARTLNLSAGEQFTVAVGSPANLSYFYVEGDGSYSVDKSVNIVWQRTTTSQGETLFAHPTGIEYLTFTLKSAGNYTVYLYVWTLNSTNVYVSDATSFENLSLTGSSWVVLNAQVAPNRGPWNALFGLTGIRLPGFNITFFDVMMFVTVCSLSSAIWFVVSKSETSLLLALFFGAVLTMLTLGLFFLGMVVAVYLLGYALIHLAWRIKGG
jgi:hypothetical protein